MPLDAQPETLARQPQQQRAVARFEQVLNLSGPTIQARCLECPSAAPAVLQRRDLSLLDLLERWLG